MANQVAGQNPPGSTGAGINPFQNTLNQTMTPGYTGGFMGQNFDWNKVSPDTMASMYMLGQMFQSQEGREEREYQRSLQLMKDIEGQREREAQKAFQMQLPFKVGGMVGNIFQNIVQAQQPGLQTELAIRSNTAPLLAQIYSAGNQAGRKWLR